MQILPDFSFFVAFVPSVSLYNTDTKERVVTMPYKQPKIPISQEEKNFFQSFYEENKGFLFYMANQYASSPADCEDVVQDTVVRLMCNIDSIKDLNKYKAAKYIALTVRSAYLDLLNRRHSGKEVSLEESIMDALLEKEDFAADASADLRMELIQLKQSLSAKEWMLLEGKYLMGYDQEELSKMLGISPDSVRMTLCRVRSKARSILLSDTGKEGGCNG